jgi:hypothetical protein
MAMGSTDAIIGSVVFITGTSAIKHTKKGDLGMHTFVSGFMLGSALLLLAMASPAIAKALAFMGAIGALINNGPAVFGLVGKLGA